MANVFPFNVNIKKDSEIYLGVLRVFIEFYLIVQSTLARVSAPPAILAKTPIRSIQFLCFLFSFPVLAFIFCISKVRISALYSLNLDTA